MQESEYVNKRPVRIKPLKEARTELISVLMQPWLRKERIRGRRLSDALKVLDIGRDARRLIAGYVDDYKFLGGTLFWEEKDIPTLQSCLKSLLQIRDSQLNAIVEKGSHDELRNLVKSRTIDFSASDIDEICNVLTKVNKDAGNKS